MGEKGNTTYQIFLLILSIYVLFVVFLETFIISDIQILLILQKIDLCICLIFLIDFVVNFINQDNKIGYLKWGWIDLISSIPLVDPFRWGRLARIVRILRFLRTIKSLKVLLSSIQKSKFQSLTLAVFLITFITYTICASLILEFESDYASGINTANEALWWSFLNIMNAKISINEIYSSGGAIITVILNKIGLLLFAYFNAMIIAWLVQKKNQTTTNKTLQDN